MSIEEKLEIAKQYIADNKSIKALKILKSLIHLKTNAFLKEKIYFEIGKIYMILNENRKSTIYLSKISKNSSVYNLAIELLLKNYKILKLPNKQIDIINKNKNFPITEQIIKDLLEATIDSNNFLMCFRFINSYKNKISNLDEILQKTYKNLKIYIQYLNKNNKYNETKKLFKNINRYIPKTEKKLKNILLNEYELAQGKIHLKSYPRVINLVLTTRCNLKCIMCRKIEHDGKYHSSDREIKDLVEIMPYLEKLTLRGGEVFLHNKILYILEQAKKYKVDIEIVTNGLLLTEKIINLLLDVLTEITFSIDSVNEDTYEKIRSGAKFKNLLENIKLFNKLNEKRNYKVFTRLNMVVMRSNYREIENVIKFASQHKFKEVYLEPIRGIEVDQAELIFSHGFDKNIIKELNEKKIYFKNLAKQYSIKLYNTLPRKKTTFNDALINRDIINQKEINKYSLLQKLYKGQYSLKLCNALISKDLLLYKKFLKESKNLKIKKQENKNTAKYCCAPWKQLFLFDTEGIPTCVCKTLFTKLNGKKNYIMNTWNNKVMQYYRYKIINKEYKDLCSKNCSEQFKIL